MLHEELLELTDVYEVQTFINEEKHIITCVFKTAIGDFTGLATCSPQDNFDYTVGKKIAYNRANRQARSAMKVFIRDNYLRGINAKLKELDTMMNKSADIIQKEKDKLDKLV